MSNLDRGEEVFEDMPCDICGSDNAEEICCAKRYTNGQPIHVCRECGFVYVKRRRSAQKIADVWSNEIYNTRDTQGGGSDVVYTARIPAVVARLTYVVETVRSVLGTSGKKVCDMGAGEGVFLDLLLQSDRAGGVEVFGIEPSDSNCRMMTGMEIDNFSGTVESYMDSLGDERSRFNLVTILWTLENCRSCRTMMRAAHDCLLPGGHVVVATGSRILTPFKKPLHYYLDATDPDTHAFRFSANTLRGLIESCGFEVVYTNRYIDSDVLCMIGLKSQEAEKSTAAHDDYREVIDFFGRWDRDTQTYFANS